MHERSDTIVAQALARQRAEDERLGGDAEAALNSLTWDEGLETITQYGLQTFLWYELPRKWTTDLEGKRHLHGAWPPARPGRAAPLRGGRRSRGSLVST